MPASIPPELVPSLPAATFAAVLAILAYFRLGSLLVLAIALGVSVAYLSEPSHPSAGSQEQQQQQKQPGFRQASAFVGDSSKDDGLGRETAPPPPTVGDDEGPPDGHYHPPAFVNHAIARLWPMINTELFVPVLDLLEDTLQGSSTCRRLGRPSPATRRPLDLSGASQAAAAAMRLPPLLTRSLITTSCDGRPAGECPPMVHSVRVESLELGKAPCEIRWLRPLTDAEWAEGLHAGGAGKGTGKLADRDLAEGEAEGGDYAVGPPRAVADRASAR